jgi:signal transduction histidine kinase
VLLSKTLHSSTLRLALIYVAVFSAAIFAVLAYVYWITADYLARDIEASLSTERLFLTEICRKTGRNGLEGLLNERTNDPHFAAWVYLLVDTYSGKIAGNLPAWPAKLKGNAGSAGFSVSNDLRAAGPPGFVQATYTTLPDGYRLLIGHSVAGLDAVRGRIATALIAAAILFLGLAAAAGISTSRRSVARIEAINRMSRQIMRSGLSERIPLRGTRDEWDGLAVNLNSMLDRIEELAAWNRRVSDNVAHDLRTPLTRLRGRLEKTYTREPDVAGYRQLVSDALAELDAILSTFSSLLRISRIEMRERMAGFNQLDLAEMAHEVVDLFDPSAEETGVQLQLRDHGPATILGDRDLLFDAVSNLIDNALKHGREGGKVSVGVWCDADEIILEVRDLGPGIPFEEREHVLRRFYRLEHSRNTPGNGLGLSLVAAVANLHGARINMADNAPGLRIELRFPNPVTVIPATACS